MRTRASNLGRVVKDAAPGEVLGIVAVNLRVETHAVAQDVRDMRPWDSAKTDGENRAEIEARSRECQRKQEEIMETLERMLEITPE